MNSRKKKSVKTKKIKEVKKSARDAEISDKELKKIQKELRESLGRSILIERDLRKMREKLSSLGRAESSPVAGSTLFYRNFVFKCGKCVEEFDHKANVTAIEHKVVCPKCNKEHVLLLKPAAGKMKVRLPKGIKLVR
ncbi:MAG: hypothetical protein JW724_02075 [Candidatus Altiarchaeota archaeon]|nr:hypothetical protein [Candidatus Altiarchaeota archaeon]